MSTAVRIACTVAAGLMAGAAAAEPPKVLASIAPIHSLAAAVMQGVSVPELLLPSAASDHDYALKPSDLQKIADADLVIWIGPSLETYLVKAIETEQPADLELLEAPGVDPHPYRARTAHPHSAEAVAPAHPDGDEALVEEAHEDHDHADHDHSHSHAGLDPHVWLDPVRAEGIVRAIADALSRLDPEHASAYADNARREAARLVALDAEIRTSLAPLADKAFITFHDGYAYFVERYGLNQVGELAVHPEQRPGAATVKALRETAVSEHVSCAFSEPQFDPGVLGEIAGEVDIRIGVLDAIGAGLEPGPSLYPSLLRSNAAAIRDCLSPGS